MAIKKVFLDENDNEMECFLNTERKVFIEVRKIGGDGYYSGFITLDKEDVKELIVILKDCQEQMED